MAKANRRHSESSRNRVARSKATTVSPIGRVGRGSARRDIGVVSDESGVVKRPLSNHCLKGGRNSQLRADNSWQVTAAISILPGFFARSKRHDAQLGSLSFCAGVRREFVPGWRQRETSLCEGNPKAASDFLFGRPSRANTPQTAPFRTGCTDFVDIFLRGAARDLHGRIVA
jgi:hypothetical protein